MSDLGTIATITRFPVKSMGGVALQTVGLDADGMVGDRTWALRDTETGKLVSAKRPRLWRAVLDCQVAGVGDDVEVALPSGDSFAITDPSLPDALGELLGRTVTVESATGPQQGTYESDWPAIEGLTLSGEIELPTNLTGEGSSFIDLGILHLITSASIDALAAAAPDARVDLRRFRPSFTIDTGDMAGFVENDWEGHRLRIGEAEIVMGMPAPRCVMTTVEQGDLPAEPSILQTIARENRLSNEMGTFACLGSYASVATPGTIRVGDAVTLL